MRRHAVLVDARTREPIDGRISDGLRRALTRCDVVGARFVGGEWVEDNSGAPDTRDVTWTYRATTVAS